MRSYFQDIEHYLIREIQLAKNRLLIAVAWFTNEKIGDEIIKKKSLDIEIVVDDNEINTKSKNIQKIKSKDIDITFVKDPNKTYYLMHNKFCVIDNFHVITGSYNWTKNANTNDENISIISNKETASYYTQEFRRIKSLALPNDNISMTDLEIKELTDTVYSELLDVIKDTIKKREFNRGLLYNWTDVKIQNSIRRIHERIRNTTLDKVGNLGIYSDLLNKYGWEFRMLASENEQALARDSFKKKGLSEIDFYVEWQLDFFKIKAIKKLQQNYSIEMKKFENDPGKLEKIQRVIIYLIEERQSIAKKIGLTITL